MSCHLRSQLTSLVVGFALAALIIGAGGVTPASAILIDDTGLLGRAGSPSVAQDPYVPQSDDPYHTGDAYSTGTSLQARQAWQPSPLITTVSYANGTPLHVAFAVTIAA